jgi:hypothetical protein
MEKQTDKIKLRGNKKTHHQLKILKGPSQKEENP